MRDGFVLLAGILLILAVACASIVRARRHGGAPVGVGLAAVTFVGGLLALAAAIAHALLASELHGSIDDCEDERLCEAELVALDQTPLRLFGASLLLLAAIMVSLLLWWRWSRAYRTLGPRPGALATGLSGGTALLVLLLGYSGLSVPHVDDVRYPDVPQSGFVWAIVGFVGFFVAVLSTIVVANVSRRRPEPVQAPRAPQRPASSIR